MNSIYGNKTLVNVAEIDLDVLEEEYLEDFLTDDIRLLEDIDSYEYIESSESDNDDIWDAIQDEAIEAMTPWLIH